MLTIPIKCPKCGKQSKETAARLKNKTFYVCPSCRTRVTLQPAFKKSVAGLGKIEDAIAQLGRKR